MVAVDLGPYLNNQGLAAEGPSAEGGLDGLGTILLRGSLPPPGSTVGRGGVPFLFTGHAAGPSDNISCEGQHLWLRPNRYRALHVLGMCDWRGSEEVLLLRYGDGSTGRALLGLTDGSSFEGPRFGEREGLRGALVARDSLVPHAFLFGIPIPDADYRMQETIWDAVVWHQTVGMDGRCVLVGCDLPDNPAMHLFGLALEESEP